MRPKTQRDLDAIRCSDPECDHAAHDGPMYLHPRCHRGAPTRCSYEKGVLSIECAVCETLVGQVAVDPGTEVRH